ncbi:MAG: 50S ribosome-binding GTPase, partial [Polyangiaceae bacterium]|nr:50S ribosome-binding GTPase [Polyangiaceae bacterium]
MLLNDQLSAQVRERLEDALRARGRVNILIAGKTGVGKSTLINSVFGGDFAKTGHGRPITEGTREISKKGIPLRVIDTRGLEQADRGRVRKELQTEIKRRHQADGSNEAIHAAWLCLSEDSRRVEEAETELCEMLENLGVPTAVIITKSRQDAGFKKEVERLMPAARNVLRVRALDEVLDDGHELPAMGLTDLVELTMELVPEAQHQAFAAAQTVSRDLKRREARAAVVAAATAAAAAGATPIPFSDSAVLIPIQIGMLAKITASYGISLEEGVLMTLISSG